MNESTSGLRARRTESPPLADRRGRGRGGNPRALRRALGRLAALAVLGAVPAAATETLAETPAETPAETSGPRPGSIASGEVGGSGSISILEGWVQAPGELVRSAMGGRPPGFGAAVSLLPGRGGRVGLLAGAPAGLSVGTGGLVLGAARTGRPASWVTGGAGSWWSGPSSLQGTPGAPVPMASDDQHGRAIAAAPAWAALGAPSASSAVVLAGAASPPQQVGAVTVLHLGTGGGPGRLAQWLHPPSGEVAGGFGSALAFLVEDGVTRALAVGSPFADDLSSGLPMVGAVHLFEPEPLAGGTAWSSWRHVRTVHPPSPRVGMSFGASLAWVAGELAIGAPGDSSLAPGAGCVHGVSRGGELRWSLRSGEPGARFGTTLCPLAVAWSAGEPGLAIGAPGRGVVHVYDLVAGAPHGVADLLGRPGAGFGLALAAAGRHLLVGAPFAGYRGVPLAGAVHRFVVGQGRRAVETLGAPAPTIGGEFGASTAALRGADGVLRLAVGEPGSHDGCISPDASCRPGRVGVFVLP